MTVEVVAVVVVVIYFGIIVRGCSLNEKNKEINFHFKSEDAIFKFLILLLTSILNNCFQI